MRTLAGGSRDGRAMIWVMAALALGIGMYIAFGVMKIHKFRQKIDEAMGKKPVTEFKNDEGVLGMHQERLRLEAEAREKVLNDMAELQAKVHKLAKDSQRAMVEAEREGGMPPKPMPPVDMASIPTDPESARRMAADMASKARQKQLEADRRIREVESEGRDTVPPSAEQRPPLQVVPENKPDADFTAEEKKVKSALEQELGSGLPTHRIVFDRNTVMTGRILSQDADSVTFMEMASGSAAMSLKIKRTRIKELQALERAAPAVTYRDVRFKMEYPSLTVLKMSPYTMLTSAKNDTSASVLKMLTGFYSGFSDRFRSVIPTNASAKQSIQVVVLSNETEFEEYRRKAGAWKRPAGPAVYSEKDDRLVILDPESAAKNRRYTWAGSAQNAIRREAAIQLCFTLGILTGNASSQSWLADGIGAYCQEEKIGQYNNSGSRSSRSRIARAPTFADYASGYADADFCSTIIHFLMQDRTQEKFFAYVTELRSDQRPRRSGQAEEIVRATGLSGDELEQRWREYIKAL